MHSGLRRKEAARRSRRGGGGELMGQKKKKSGPTVGHDARELRELAKEILLF